MKKQLFKISIFIGAILICLTFLFINISAQTPTPCPDECEYCTAKEAVCDDSGVCDKHYCGEWRYGGGSYCDCWYEECILDWGYEDCDTVGHCQDCQTRFTCCEELDPCDCDLECPPGMECTDGGYCGVPCDYDSECSPDVSCIDGYCGNVDAYCEETDSGEDYTQEGTTTLYKGDGTLWETKTDDCLDGNRLREYYYSESTDTINYSFYNCDNEGENYVCESGACTEEIPASPSPSPSPFPQTCDEYCKTEEYTTYRFVDGARVNNLKRKYIRGQCNDGDPGGRWEQGAWDNPPDGQGLGALSPSRKLAQNKVGETVNNLLASIGGLFKREEKEPQEKEAELVDCSDFYREGKIEFGAPMTKPNKPKAGDEISFRVNVLNKNDYPIADGMVFARIYREKKDKEISEADYLVDEFIAVEDINLWSEEEKEIKFIWSVPQNSIGGRYKAALYFASSKQFNLSGWSFSHAIVGMRILFDIEGNEKGFWFDNSSIQVNEWKDLMATSVPSIEQGETVSIVVPLKSTLVRGRANLSADLYYVNLLKEENRLVQYHESRKIFLGPFNQLLEFNFSGLEPGAYLAKVLVEGENQKSLLNVRFAIPGERGRFRFSGLSEFPLKKGDQFTLLSCFLNGASQASLVHSFPGSVNIELKDKKTGKTLGRMTYTGLITPDPIGIKQQFTASRGSDNLILISQLFDLKGDLMEEVKTEYNIDNFSGRELPAEKKTSWLKIILIALLIIIGLVILYLLINKKRLGEKSSKIFFIMIAGLVLLFLFGIAIFVSSSSFTATFRCIEDDQSCCGYLYEKWRNIPGTIWEQIEIERGLQSVFVGAPIVKKESNDTQLIDQDCDGDNPCPPGFHCGSVNKCVMNITKGDKIIDEHPLPGGEIVTESGWMVTPAINWVDDTGIGGSGIYYSDPGRNCDCDCDVNDHRCPPGAGWFVGQSVNFFDVWCNGAWQLLPGEYGGEGNEQGLEPSFDDLKTYVLRYNNLGTFPGVSYGSFLDGACIGTQVACERTATITTDPAKMKCTLTDADDSTRTCNTDDEPPLGTCSLKAAEVNSECIPKDTATGEISITISNDFDCFAYLDRGIFVETEEGWQYSWDDKNDAENLCQPFGEEGNCWCEKVEPEMGVVNQTCHGFYYPMKLTLTDPPSSILLQTITHTYYVSIVNSTTQVSGASGAGTLEGSTVKIDKAQLPDDVTFELTYSEMYTGAHGFPDVVNVDCGNDGTYNNDGTCDGSGCSFSCNYPATASVGSYTAHVRIENEEKFAETDIPVEITENNPPYAINLQVQEGDCCFRSSYPAVFSWEFKDDDGDSQSAYWIQIDDNSDFSSPFIDYEAAESSWGFSPSSATSNSFDGSCESSADRPFCFNPYYYWRIQVKDDGAWSPGWIYPPSSLAPDYTASGTPFVQLEWPKPDFKYNINNEPPEGISCDNSDCNSELCTCKSSPIEPNEGDKITIVENTTSCPNPPCTYEWTTSAGEWNFTDDSADIPVPDNHIYLDSAVTDILGLRVTDAAGNSCKIELNIGVGGLLSPPKWEEIPPFSWLRKALVAVSGFLRFNL